MNIMIITDDAALIFRGPETVAILSRVARYQRER